LIAAAQSLNFVGGILEGKDKNGEYIENVMDIEVWDKNSANAIQKYCKLKDCIFVSGVVKCKLGKIKIPVKAAVSMC
jgi:hypothetical protein